MRPGSIVICIRIDPIEYKLIKPDMETRYTVRDVIAAGTQIDVGDTYSVFMVYCIPLEEITNRVVYIQDVPIIEPAYAAHNWREILPPIENIEEFINDNTFEPQLV